MTKKQIIAESNRIRSDLRQEKMDDTQKQFMRNFINKKKKMIWFFVFLTFMEVLIGIALPVISHFYLGKSFDLMNYRMFLYVGVSMLILIVIYMFNTYHRLFVGEKIAISLMNEIREAWYVYFLRNSAAAKRNFDGRQLMTKFMYHVQLLKLGVQNIINEGLQAILLYSGILIFAILFNPQLFLVLWLGLPIFLIIFLISDYIGRYYVSREQTFNSKIVAHLADSLMNFEVIKSQAREEEKLKELDNLIELDTYFRIRRQLWIKYSNRVLYGAILVFGVLLYFVQMYYPFIDLGSLTSVASTGIILGYFTRLLFSMSRIGIFFEAFRLGLRLAVPGFNSDLKRYVKKAPAWKNLRIHSKKTKLSKYGGYIKDFELNIKKGEKISVIANGPWGKTTLGRLIVGQKCIDSIIFNLDKKRVFPKTWSRYKGINYLISGNPRFDLSIGEYLLGKNMAKITQPEIDKIYINLKRYRVFGFLTDHRDTFGRRIDMQDLSFTETVLLQIAYCILNPKNIVVIDHLCIDTLNDQIKEGVEILADKAKKSAIIVISSKKNNYLNYEKTYDLGETWFKGV